MDARAAALAVAASAALAVAATGPRAARGQGRAATPYVPGPGDDWARRRPAEVGLDSARLAEAIAFAVARESRNPRSMAENHERTFGREPYGNGVGPFRDRGPATGVILRGGHLVAEWGEPWRVDMTHSVTKSFLSAVVGLALDRRLIASVDDRVADAVGPVMALPNGPGSAAAPGAVTVLAPFDTPHNRTVTWDHLLRQTSDWEGTLWGKPEWADRPDPDASTWRTRARKPAGSAWEYNDVRVNALALAATQVWRRPLPAVLRDEIMDPIGASRTWQWMGYETSWLVLDGQAVQAVSGGGHWGGGMFVHARDLARFGLLTLRRGRWGDRQLLSEATVRRALTPTTANPQYGWMNWFLNTDRKYLPSAPASAFVHVGNGTNAVYVDPEHDLVAVVRWIENDALDGFVRRLLAADVRASAGDGRRTAAPAAGAPR